MIPTKVAVNIGQRRLITTLAEVVDLEESVGSDFDFDLFLRILNRPDGFRAPGLPEDFVRGFQVFDKDGTGLIGVGELKYVLTSLGEKLTEDEVDELLKGINVAKDGSINYTEFVQMVLAN